MPCAADTLLASRFGVLPQVDYIHRWRYQHQPPGPPSFYSAYTFDPDSLAPNHNTASTNYVVDGWFGYWDPNNLSTPLVDHPGTGTRPTWGEPYDVEALYFDDDADNLYFAVIMGFHSPAEGIFVEERLGIPVVQGDFAIDFGLPGSQTDNWGFRYNYGIDITTEIRPTDPQQNVTQLYSNTIGTGVYRTTDGWYLGTPQGAVNPVPGDPSDAYTNFDPNWNGGQGMYFVGHAVASWYELQLYHDGDPVNENNWATWVLEITLPRSVVPGLSPGEQLAFRWLPGGRNEGNAEQEFITGHGTITTPEPSTIMLFALGAGQLGQWLRRRRHSGNAEAGGPMRARADGRRRRHAAVSHVPDAQAED